MLGRQGPPPRGRAGNAETINSRDQRPRNSERRGLLARAIPVDRRMKLVSPYNDARVICLYWRECYRATPAGVEQRTVASETGGVQYGGGQNCRSVKRAHRSSTKVTRSGGSRYPHRFLTEQLKTSHKRHLGDRKRNRSDRSLCRKLESDAATAKRLSEVSREQAEAIAQALRVELEEKEQRSCATGVVHRPSQNYIWWGSCPHHPTSHDSKDQGTPEARRVG
jgi:hypothetical protein